MKTPLEQPVPAPRANRVLAVVPARGGSKGIAGKNLRRLGGRPLLLHTIEHALRATRVDRVVVSTDDRAIARVAREGGAEVVDRPAALAGDTASSESALVHVMGTLREREGYEPDLVVFLQATSPLRRPDDVDRAVAKLEADGADSLFSACPLHGFVWRRRGSELRALTYDPAHRGRRQDLGEDLLENGSIYVFKPWVLERYGHRLGGKVTVYPMDPLDSFQVDEPSDLVLLERLLALPPSTRNQPDLSRIRLLVLDFDGVMTDDRVVVDEIGREAVTCSRSDGFGLERLQNRTGVEALVLSKETNPVVAARCRKLGLTCFQGYDEKLPQLERLAAERSLELSEIAYVGNDLNDLEPMRWCGVAIAVADARAEVLAAADFVTRRPGGHGAVREVCDLLLEEASKEDEILL